MPTSDNQHRIPALSVVAAVLIATGLLLAAAAAAWAQNGIDVSPEGDITLRDGDKLIQVDESCVLLRDGERDLSVGDQCPEDKPQDKETPEATPEDPEPQQQSSDGPQDPAQQLGGTTGGQTVPEATTETTVGSTDPVATGSTVPDDSSGLQQVTVERAVDGDTLQISPRIEGADTVRLIGLDTPEMATDEAPTPEPLAEEAAAFTAESLEGQEVLLELDEDLKDDYERLLAYVWVEDPAESDEPATAEEPGSLYNETLLRQGYAKIFTVEPNVLYLDRLETAEAAAQEEELGVWGLEAEEEGTVPSTGPSTTLGTTQDPEAVPTANQEPLEPSEEQTAPEETASEETASEQTASEETLQEETLQEETSPGTLGTTFESTGSLTNQGLQGGTTVTTDPTGETTMGTTGGTTMESPESTEMEAFDPEGLKREATRLAQETLEPQDPPTEPEAEPQDITPSSLDADPSPATPASDGLPASQPTEPPVQILPDSGGPALVILLGALLITAGTALMAYDRRISNRSRRLPDHPDQGRRGG